MKAAAWALIIAGLVLSIVSAVTAYSPKLSLPDAVLQGRNGAELILAAPAGRTAAPTTAPSSLARAGDPLTPHLLEQLRASDQRRVRVKEFSFARWSESWLFALGCAGMFAGAMLIRHVESQALSGASGSGEVVESAESALANLRRELADLRRELSSGADVSQRLSLIIDGVGKMTTDHVPPFLSARPKLISQLGLSGYAQLMDRFAAGERKLNRAWSAAADQYPGEALSCLDEAEELLEQAASHMPR